MSETGVLPPNTGPILFNQEDLDSPLPKRPSQATSTRAHRVLFTTKLLFLVSLITLPTIVDAGVFSFVFDRVRSTDSVTKVVQADDLNSQTMSLLKATLNPDPTSGKGGGDITIVGDVALLPESGPSGTLADIVDAKPTSDQISIYVVREGDTLSQIAKMFNVTTNTIIWANDIERGSLIAPGQTLVILPISGIQYTVKKGDTLASVAKKYNGDVKEIVRYNNLTEDTVLAVGDSVTIPDGEIPIPKRIYSTSVVRNAGGPTYSGYYLRPVTGGTRSQGLHGYNAVDIATYTGAPIFASANGGVIISKNLGWNGGYGKYVVIRHDNGTQTLYAHNSENIVSVGQRVVQGQVIGYVGATGKSTGSHVHFEIRGAGNPF